ncbi:ABC transporter ATP-binding protein [Sulfodiicoccus acidiphilus]|uniref:ABC transporter ATP-binding protein n=1 Tax=Sulfodiicoccus acidiphilus TaxID=1670455 RepID=UPI00166B4B66|nr:ABC transporter ATP-binding protein [Sulfodiicoccus acidiphilus]
MQAVEVQDLRKTYGGKVEALKGITFSVGRGEVFTLLGPNGAGKTTTLGILSCVLSPTSGKVAVLGMQVPRECAKIRREVGVMPQQFQGFSDLTVEENVGYFAGLYGENEWRPLISKLGLESYSRVRYRALSGGLKRRVGLACALAGRPRILFLDEPTVGLDPKARRSLWEVVKSLKGEGVTVLMTTHYLDEAQRLSDRVAVIYGGRVLKVDTPEAVMNEFHKESLEEAYLSLMEGVEE